VEVDDLQTEQQSGSLVFYTRKASAVIAMLDERASKERVALRGGKWFATTYKLPVNRDELLFEAPGKAYCGQCQREAAEKCSCKGACFRCGKHGHEAASCANARRCRACVASNSATCQHFQCFVCGESGHFGRECKSGVQRGPCTLVLMDLPIPEMEALVNKVIEQFGHLLNHNQAEGGVKLWTSFGKGKAAVYFKSRAAALKVKEALHGISFTSEKGEIRNPRIEEATSPRSQQQQRSQPAQQPRPNPATQKPHSQPWRPQPQQTASAEWPSLSDPVSKSDMMASMKEMMETMMVTFTNAITQKVASEIAMQQELFRARQETVANARSARMTEDYTVPSSQLAPDSNEQLAELKAMLFAQKSELATLQARLHAVEQENDTLKEQLSTHEQQTNQTPAATPVRNLNPKSNASRRNTKSGGC